MEMTPKVKIINCQQIDNYQNLYLFLLLFKLFTFEQPNDAMIILYLILERNEEPRKPSRVWI